MQPEAVRRDVALAGDDVVARLSLCGDLKLIWQAQFKFRSKEAVIAVWSPGHHLAVRRLPLL
jgi:hypothetical protein